MRRTQLALLLALTLATGFVAGALLGPSSPAHARTEAYAQLGVFSEVLAHVQRSYVHDVDETALLRGAVRGLVGELDAHSAYLDPDAYRALQDDNRNAYVGVGIEIQPGEFGVVIGQVFRGGPAHAAGLEPGDIIHRVDGEDVRDASLPEIVQRLRGERGTAVSLQVERDTGEHTELLSFDLVRDVVERQIVHASMPVEGFGHIRLVGFRQRTSEQLRDAISGLERDAGGSLRGLVLDLRGNTGGLLRESIRVADLFLDDGEIVSTRGRHQAPGDQWRARRGNTAYRAPLVVLVDDRSASASEIVAGALQDHGRGVIMGQQTYGKGSVQSLFDLGDGSGLKLTVSLYYTPRGRSIQQHGISPDILVEAGEVEPVARTSRESRNQRSLANPDGDPPPPDSSSLDAVTDRPLRSALEQLHAFDVFQRAHAR